MGKPTEHTVMIRESVPGEQNSEKYKYRAVCSCGEWQGNLWAMKSFARGSKAAADFIDAYSKRVRKPS